MGVPINMNHPPSIGLPVSIIVIITPKLHNVGAKYGQTSLKNSGSLLAFIIVVFRFISDIYLFDRISD